MNVKAKEERAERAKSRRKRQIEQQLKEAAEKRKCIDEPGQPVHEINFSGDFLDEDTLDLDEKQESTVDETEAVADELQLQLMNLTICLPAVTSLIKHLRNQNFKMMMSELVFIQVSHHLTF